MLEDVVKKVNAQLPDNLRIRAFTSLFKEFHPDDGEMTRTRKLRRLFITERYKELIEAMYEGKPTHTLRLTVRYEDGTTREVEMAVEIRRL